MVRSFVRDLQSIMTMRACVQPFNFSISISDPKYGSFAEADRKYRQTTLRLVSNSTSAELLRLPKRYYRDESHTVGFDFSSLILIDARTRGQSF